MCKPSFIQIAEILWNRAFNAVKAASCPNRKDQQRGIRLSGLHVFQYFDDELTACSSTRHIAVGLSYMLHGLCFPVHATEYTLIYNFAWQTRYGLFVQSA